MKFEKLFNLTQNKRTKQISFNVRSKEVKKIGLEPKQLLNMTIPKNEIKFFKDKNIKERNNMKGGFSGI